MDTAALATRARKMSREEFATKHAGFYIVIGELIERESIGYQTAVLSFRSRGFKHEAPRSDDYEVLPLVKAPGNPYPERISLGRARNCDLVIRDASVSKLHAHFVVRSGGRYDLVDLESQNGTLLNGLALTPHIAEFVEAGDNISFGGVSARLIDAEDLFDLLTRD